MLAYALRDRTDPVEHTRRLRIARLMFATCPPPCRSTAAAPLWSAVAALYGVSRALRTLFMGVYRASRDALSAYMTRRLSRCREVTLRRREVTPGDLKLRTTVT